MDLAKQLATVLHIVALSNPAGLSRIIMNWVLKAPLSVNRKATGAGTPRSGGSETCVDEERKAEKKSSRSTQRDRRRGHGGSSVL